MHFATYAPDEVRRPVRARVQSLRTRAVQPRQLKLLPEPVKLSVCQRFDKHLPAREARGINNTRTYYVGEHGVGLWVQFPRLP